MIMNRLGPNKRVPILPVITPSFLFFFFIFPLQALVRNHCPGLGTRWQHYHSQTMIVNTRGTNKGLPTILAITCEFLFFFYALFSLHTV